MSSAPPPMPVHIGSLPTAFGTAAPDYGPLGTTPAGAGVTHFPQKSSNRVMPTVVLILGVLGIVLGIFMLAHSSGGSAIPHVVGVLFLVFGYFLRKSQVDTDVVCDTLGVTVRRSSRKNGLLPPTFIPWHSVTGLRCWVTVTRGGENTGEKSEQHFGMETGTEMPFSISEYAIRNFPALVELAGQHTPQLPYRWLWKRNAKGLQALEQAGHFVKVSR